MFEQLNKQNSTTQEPEWELYLIYENDEIINYDGDYDFSRIKDIKLEINLPMLVCISYSTHLRFLEGEQIYKQGLNSYV